MIAEIVVEIEGFRAGDHQGSQISIDEQTFVARVVMNGSKPMK